MKEKIIASVAIVLAVLIIVMVVPLVWHGNKQGSGERIGGTVPSREEFDGHSYIVINIKRHGMGLTHDPDCKCKKK